MKDKNLNRDYPLSETKMSSDEDKKKVSDVKSNIYRQYYKYALANKEVEKNINRDIEKILKSGPVSRDDNYQQKSRK